MVTPYLLRKAYKRLGIRFKRVKVRRAFRRPDQLRLIGEDRKKLLLMVDTVLSAPLEQLAEIIFLDECIFSVKSFKHMAWANTGENIQ